MPLMRTVMRFGLGLILVLTVLLSVSVVMGRVFLKSDQFAFVQQLPAPFRSQVYLLDASRYFLYPLATVEGYIQRLSWSPDGNTLYFSAPGLRETGVGFGRDLVALDIRRRTLTRLTRTHDDYEPVMSPDGAALAFVRVENEANIYTFNVQTRQVAALYRSVDQDSWPSWSGDSSRLAVQVCARFNGVCAVTVVNLADQRRVYTYPDRSSRPAWSPREDALTVETINEQFNTVLVLLRGNGTTYEEHPLTDGRFSDHSVTWSPHGERIAFLREQRGVDGLRLIVMDVEGGSPRAVTPPSLLIAAPVWRPR
jgi:Tol biopolymer transport system component